MRNQIVRIACLLPLFIASISNTNSFFSDGLVLEGNIFSIGYWDTPPDAGEVVINEIMWMGSTAAASDQWLELKNTTDRPIDISGCELANVGADNQILAIEDGKTIEPNDYFLIAKKEPGATALADGVVIDQVAHSVSFHNDYSKNGVITLTCDGTLIDQTPEPEDKNWPAGTDRSGSGKLKQSMERNADISTGWHTCVSEVCTLPDFWTQANNYGTPGAPNSSESAPAYLPTTTDLSLSLDPSKKFAILEINGFGLRLFTQANFTLTYMGDGVPQKIIGEINIPANDYGFTHKIKLATCTSGGVCTFSQGISDVFIEVVLGGQSIQRTLTGKINN